MLYARKLALDAVLAAGGDRVAVFGLTNESGLPIYVHSKVCVIDDRWASVGSDNFNRRSWTSDSEIACAVQDERTPADGPAPDDAFPSVLRRLLVAEHLGCSPDEVPDDPVALFDAMVASAADLDEWLDGATGRRSRLRDWSGRAVSRTRRRRGQRSARARVRAARSAGALVGRADELGGRPPGRLRRLGPPALTAAQERWAALLYPVFDPDGTVLRDEDLEELTTPDVADGPADAPLASSTGATNE